jgi:glutathione peroxidase
VIGGAAHPFYRWVAAQLGEAGAPRWNFHKYLVGPDGQLAGGWPSQVKPTDAAITSEIEGMLPPV